MKSHLLWSVLASFVFFGITPKVNVEERLGCAFERMLLTAKKIGMNLANQN